MKLIAPIIALAALTEAKRRQPAVRNPSASVATINECLKKEGSILYSKQKAKWKQGLAKCDNVKEIKECKSKIRCKAIADCVVGDQKLLAIAVCKDRPQGKPSGKKPAKSNKKKGSRPAQKRPAGGKPGQAKPAQGKPSKGRPSKKEIQDKKAQVCEKIREVIPGLLSSAAKTQFDQLYAERMRLKAAGNKAKKGDRLKAAKKWRSFVCRNGIEDAIHAIQAEIFGASFQKKSYECSESEAASDKQEVVEANAVDNSEGDEEVIEFSDEFDDFDSDAKDDADEEEESDSDDSEMMEGDSEEADFDPEAEDDSDFKEDHEEDDERQKQQRLEEPTRSNKKQKKKRGKRPKQNPRIAGRSFDGSSSVSPRQEMFNTLYKDTAFDTAYYAIVNEFREFNTKKMNKAVDQLQELIEYPCTSCYYYNELEKFFTLDMGVMWVEHWNVINQSVIGFVDAWDALEDGENLDDLEF